MSIEVWKAERFKSSLYEMDERGSAQARDRTGSESRMSIAENVPRMSCYDRIIVLCPKTYE